MLDDAVIKIGVTVLTAASWPYDILSIHNHNQNILDHLEL